MAAKKKATSKTSLPALQERQDEQPAQTQEPGDINDALSSDRMKALLEDHRKMGTRP